MGQKKLIRFAELETFSNVLQNPPGMPGQWHRFFRSENPIILELACGKGEYAVGLAQLYPERNFIGVDVKGNRLWVGAKKALQQGLHNVAFLRIQIDRITELFARDEVAEIWITFPDPQLRLSKDKKRLTHPKFLRLYQQFLQPNGRIHLKTDSPQLYRFTEKVIQLYNCTLHEAVEDVYRLSHVKPELTIKTYYESLDIAGSKQVHYLSFSLPQQLPGTDLDRILHEELKNERV
ncbi:MAG: tRNA (guanosine(46)-N7)-methyltransferase TrmB [Flavisolibacter sp.]|nr:tRNA (guanosine(46)-N7)-methyltransferase TrmB [Flavisolibacter sp.]